MKRRIRVKFDLDFNVDEEKVKLGTKTKMDESIVISEFVVVVVEFGKF